MRNRLKFKIASAIGAVAVCLFSSAATATSVGLTETTYKAYCFDSNGGFIKSYTLNHRDAIWGASIDCRDSGGSDLIVSLAPED